MKSEPVLAMVEGDEEGEDSDELGAAADLRAALKGNDDEALLLAFKAMMKVC